MHENLHTLLLRIINRIRKEEKNEWSDVKGAEPEARSATQRS